MSIATYLLFGLWVLKVHIKKREEIGEKARIFKDIKDDDEENVYVFALWPYVVYKWWFGKKDNSEVK